MRQLQVNPATKRSDEYAIMFTHDEIRTINASLDNCIEEIFYNDLANKAIVIRNELSKIIT